MELSSSDVYKILNPLTKADDPSLFIATLQQLCADKTIKREAADDLIFYTTSALYHLASHNLLDQGVRVVEAYLAISAGHPVSADKRWYFVEKALTIIRPKPELANELATKIIGNTLAEEHSFVKVVQYFAELGCRELTLAFAQQAIAFNFDLDLTQERHVAIQKIYNQDKDFKEKIDSAKALRLEKNQRIETPGDFSSTLEAAQDAIQNLRLSYSNPQRILAVTQFKEPQYRRDIENFLSSGFAQLKDIALRSGKLVDHILFDAMARAIGNWGDPQFGELLMSEFNFVVQDEDKDEADYIARHYELNQTCGSIALALASLNYAGDISGFDTFLDSFEWRYPGSDFVMQTRYAKWLLNKNPEEAATFLADPENKQGASYAVSAIADLDYKPALALIQQKQSSLRNPITQEVFKEAIARLQQQKAPPSPQERIINLFGRVTPTEMALGAESDNVFLSRAQHTLQNSQFGTIYDEEYLAPED
ncbi:MAG TPA: hypothetical protein VN030_15045 [Cellvibrio sp.]|nr:hypothetical protein [Cellvibrio sp.]